MFFFYFIVCTLYIFNFFIYILSLSQACYWHQWWWALWK